MISKAISAYHISETAGMHKLAANGIIVHGRSQNIFIDGNFRPFLGSIRRTNRNKTLQGTFKWNYELMAC